MNAQNFIQLLAHPENCTATHTEHFRDITKEFPYFQAAHALYLKGLKNEDSYGYNTALKQTAVRTTDRTMLFDYITSESFIQNEISSGIKTQENRLHEITVIEEVDVSQLLEDTEQEKANKILDPGLFVEKKNSLLTPSTPEETLSLGKPLVFDKNESYSFSEWLKLSSLQPIDRSNEATLSPEKKSEPQKESLQPEEDTQTSETSSSPDEVRKRKQQIIDSFIETNPKIQINTTPKGENKTVFIEPPVAPEALMTETLARVYIEQKNYKKAKQAFRILSLKYPEKSGFFADQIRAVEQLEEQKD